MSVKSLQGHLLVATVDLVDPNFHKSVVLLVRHDDDGALGLVLNRPTRTSLKQVWKEVGSSPCNFDAVLYLGGPVQGPLFALHAHAEISTAEVIPGAFFSPDPAELEQLAAREEGQIRFFAGYAGWGAGQLEREIGERSWLTAPASADDVFADPQDAWDAITRRISTERMGAALRLRHLPDNPEEN